MGECHDRPILTLIILVKEAIIDAKDEKAASESHAQATQKEAMDPVLAFQLVSKSIKLDP